MLDVKQASGFVKGRLLLNFLRLIPNFKLRKSRPVTNTATCFLSAVLLSMMYLASCKQASSAEKSDVAPGAEIVTQKPLPTPPKDTISVASKKFNLICPVCNKRKDSKDDELCAKCHNAIELNRQHTKVKS
jgi:hypothetical protein